MNTRKSLFFLFFCCSLPLFTGCGTLSRMETDLEEAAVARYARSGDLQAEVDTLARPLIEKGVTPGLVVGVLRPDGTRSSFGYGVTERNGDRRPDGGTLFAIGSTSKGFLSAVAAVLVQEGRLAWDDTLEALLPEDVALSPDAKKITLEQLATHRSGLPRQPFTLRFAAYFMQHLFTGENFYRHLDRDYLLNYLGRFRASARDRPRYSNIGYGVLGCVLEERTGQPLATLAREKLLHPLGLHATGYDPDPLQKNRARARGHAGDQPKLVRRGSRVPEWPFSDAMLGSAGLYSTADDMLAFAHAHLSSTEEEALDRALQDSRSVRAWHEGTGRAPAWVVEEVAGYEFTYQFGVTGGFSSYIGMNVDQKTAVVVLQNCLNWTGSIGHRLLLLMARAEESGPALCSAP